MVSPLVGGMSRIAEEIGTKAFDADEREGGINAFSALMYQYGAQMDARVLVAMWVAGVSMPRIIHAVKEAKDKRQLKVSQTTIEAVKQP